MNATSRRRQAQHLVRLHRRDLLFLDQGELVPQRFIVGERHLDPLHVVEGEFARDVKRQQIRKRAMIFTTNKNPKRWGPVLHDDDLAEAIVDRILERGRLLKLDGPSIRTHHLPELETVDDQPNDLDPNRRVSGTDAAEFPEPTT